MKTLILLFLLFIILNQTLSSYIDFIIKTTNNTDEEIGDYQLFLPLTFLSQQTTIRFLYDTSSNIIVVNQNEIKESRLSNIIDDQRTFLRTTYGCYHGKISKDKISFDSLLPNNATFFVLSTNISYSKQSDNNYSIWGLGTHKGNFNLNKYSNESLIEQLYNSNKIPYSNFGHIITDRNKNKLSFFYGEYYNYNNYHYCISNKDKSIGDSWNCRMKMIKFSTGSAISIKSRNAIFTTGLNRIVMPKNDFERFIEEFTLLTQCLIIKLKPLKVKCSYLSRRRVPNIIFSFSSFELHLNKTDYLIRSPTIKNEYLSPIEYSDSNDYWLLGLPLLMKYDMMFDYESNHVVFLNLLHEDSISANNPKYKGALISFCLSLIIFLLYILYVLYLRIRSRKNCLKDNKKSINHGYDNTKERLIDIKPTAMNNKYIKKTSSITL